ncbi:hypothetical protein E2C01_043833 [Portunus trituberculatus]|uniref:Uncharacterized protein n=1 Tax=Portunus trituberculatus TaxID=210409 RepID=A0A5B7FXF5_PORTR|nr:hypothetical protein [Portunus trituberculatus]
MHLSPTFHALTTPDSLLLPSLVTPAAAVEELPVCRLCPRPSAIVFVYTGGAAAARWQQFRSPRTLNVLTS